MNRFPATRAAVPSPVVLLMLLAAVSAVPPSGAAAGATSAADGRGMDRVPMVVTTDTASYCSALSDRIAARGSLPPAVCALRREGDALCARGEVRTGIRRLRRALVALDAEGDTVPATGPAEGCR